MATCASPTPNSRSSRARSAEQLAASSGRASVGAALLALLPVVFFADCRRAPATEEQPARAETSSKLWNYPEERWDDPALARQPRLQFVWHTPDERRPSIFSMKLDGTDIRRVAGPELLYSGEAKSLSQVPVRSPDRRYVACVGDDANGDQLRFLVDLKTRTVRTMMKTSGAVHFNWTPDSKHALFYGDIKLWQYDVDSGKTTELPMIYSRGLYLVDEGRRFVAIRENRIEQYDRSGKLVRKLPLPFEPGTDHSISGDARLIAFDLRPESLVVPIDHPDKPVFHGQQPLRFPAFGPDGRTLYFFDSNDLLALDVSSGGVTHLTRFPGALPGWTTALAAVGRP